MKETTMNPELQNRLSKVFKLANTIERLTGTTDAIELTQVAHDFDDWETLARVAKVNPPSEETIRLVRHFFAERARFADDPFVGL